MGKLGLFVNITAHGSYPQPTRTRGQTRFSTIAHATPHFSRRRQHRRGEASPRVCCAHVDVLREADDVDAGDDCAVPDAVFPLLEVVHSPVLGDGLQKSKRERGWKEEENRKKESRVGGRKRQGRRGVRRERARVAREPWTFVDAKSRVKTMLVFSVHSGKKAEAFAATITFGRGFPSAGYECIRKIAPSLMHVRKTTGVQETRGRRRE